MCLGGRGSSKPALQQRTLPAEGKRPVDESTNRNPVEPTMERVDQGIDKRAKTKNWDDVDAASPSKSRNVSRLPATMPINY
tara:strand:+ start:443 stop:685 length:243 start_codon:yes stop_codon:yes gene_type:complete